MEKSNLIKNFISLIKELNFIYIEDEFKTGYEKYSIQIDEIIKKNKIIILDFQNKKSKYNAILSGLILSSDVYFCQKNHYKIEFKGRDQGKDPVEIIFTGKDYKFQIIFQPYCTIVTKRRFSKKTTADVYDVEEKLDGCVLNIKFKKNT
ncbi:MAG: hypothetical protein NT068_02985 [Candidatus Nomurabacteria bacterium]|nr:hypothetical protein [Candidatus Nomurabacteria bacterium]